MIPGPANVLSCPFCGGTKEVMSLVSGNTFGGTVWSDTRREYPMLPEVSPIQQCPHCNRYYFVEQAKHEYDNKKESFELGKLTYSQLKEARLQMEDLSLTKMQRWILNHQIFMAYNDCFRRNPDEVAFPPGEEDKNLYGIIIDELLDGLDTKEDFELFHAELLRESGQYEKAKAVLARHNAQDDKWVVEAMLKHIDKRDSLPFMLINQGRLIND